VSLTLAAAIHDSAPSPFLEIFASRRGGLIKPSGAALKLLSIVQAHGFRAAGKKGSDAILVVICLSGAYDASLKEIDLSSAIHWRLTSSSLVICSSVCPMDHDEVIALRQKGPNP